MAVYVLCYERSDEPEKGEQQVEFATEAAMHARFMQMCEWPELIWATMENESGDQID